MANDKKISEFTQVPTFDDSDSLNIVRSGVNNKIPASALASYLGVTGTITPVGTAGTPILEQPSGTTNNIRTIEDGSGILSAISPTNGITLKQNFTFDKTGAALIVDETIASPVFRSIVSGSGIAVGVSGNAVVISASAVGASNTVIINQISDFPPASGGVITLTDNTNYIIAANVSTSDRFVFGANNAITASNALSPTLTYTGTGDMFTGVDISTSMTEVQLNAPSGTIFNVSNPSLGLNIINLFRVVVVSCSKYGVFSNMFGVDITDCNCLSAGDGVEFQGPSGSVISLSKFALISTSASFIGVDLGTSIHNTLEITNMFFSAPAGATGISGLASSGNVSAGNLATVNSSTMSGGLTPLSGITSSDIRWDFQSNTGVADTITDALLAFNGNATETVISTINTPVAVNATWVEERSSKFTTNAAGRATYTGERDVFLPIDIALDLKSASGGSIDVSIYVAINGAFIANSKATLSVSSSIIAFTSIPWQKSLSENDYVEVFVENNTNTVNLIVDHAVLRIN